MTIFEGVIAGIITLWLGSTEIRMRNLNSRLTQAPSEADMQLYVDIKQEALKAEQAAQRANFARLEAKIDRLIDLQLSRKD